jgi:hypothetical protein
MSATAPVTVTTSATELLAATANPHSGGSPGIVVVQNSGATDVFLGPDENVLVTAGILVAAGSEFLLPLPAGRRLFGITASGSSAVRVEVF